MAVIDKSQLLNDSLSWWASNSTNSSYEYKFGSPPSHPCEISKAAAYKICSHLVPYWRGQIKMPSNASSYHQIAQWTRTATWWLALFNVLSGGAHWHFPFEFIIYVNSVCREDGKCQILPENGTVSRVWTSSLFVPKYVITATTNMENCNLWIWPRLHISVPSKHHTVCSGVNVKTPDLTLSFAISCKVNSKVKRNRAKHIGKSRHHHKMTWPHLVDCWPHAVQGFWSLVNLTWSWWILSLAWTVRVMLPNSDDTTDDFGKCLSCTCRFVSQKGNDPYKQCTGCRMLLLNINCSAKSHMPCNVLWYPFTCMPASRTTYRSENHNITKILSDDKPTSFTNGYKLGWFWWGIHKLPISTAFCTTPVEHYVVKMWNSWTFGNWFMDNGPDQSRSNDKTINRQNDWCILCTTSSPDHKSPNWSNHNLRHIYP